MSKSSGGFASAMQQVLRYTADEKSLMQQRAAWTRDTRAVDPEGKLDPAELARKVDAERRLRMARLGERARAARASKKAREERGHGW
jgi:hypothetical protein